MVEVSTTVHEGQGNTEASVLYFHLYLNSMYGTQVIRYATSILHTESSLHTTQKMFFFYSGDKQDNIFHWDAYN